MQRRINVFVLLALILGVLAACGTPASTTPSGSAEASESGGASPSTSTAASPSGSASGSASAGASGSSGAAASGDVRTCTTDYTGALNYWVLGYTPGNQFAIPMERAVAAFQAANPNISVELTGYPPNDEGFTRLSTALQSGQGVDVLRSSDT